MIVIVNTLNLLFLEVIYIGKSSLWIFLNNISILHIIISFVEIQFNVLTILQGSIINHAKACCLVTTQVGSDSEDKDDIWVVLCTLAYCLNILGTVAFLG